MRKMYRLKSAEGRKGRFRVNGATPRGGVEGPTPLSDAFEWVSMALTLAAGALLLWLWCAGTPAQPSAEADAERTGQEGRDGAVAKEVAG